MNAVVEKNPLSRSEQASKIIRNYSLGSMVPSLMPVPLLDLAAVTGIQLKMLHSLSGGYLLVDWRHRGFVGGTRGLKRGQGDTRDWFACRRGHHARDQWWYDLCVGPGIHAAL